MRNLTELVSETESILKKDKKSIVEINVKFEYEADFIVMSLTKYDVRKVSVVSAYEPTAYSLHVTNK